MIPTSDPSPLIANKQPTAVNKRQVSKIIREKTRAIFGQAAGASANDHLRTITQTTTELPWKLKQRSSHCDPQRTIP